MNDIDSRGETESGSGISKYNGNIQKKIAKTILEAGVKVGHENG